MGNEPGPLEKGEKANVLIVMKGVVTAPVADGFTQELDALLARYRGSTGGLDRPIKAKAKAKAKGKAKRPTTKKKSKKKR